MPLRVVFAEDDFLVREGTAALLGQVYARRRRGAAPVVGRPAAGPAALRRLPARGTTTSSGSGAARALALARAPGRWLYARGMAPADDDPSVARGWTFLTNHAHVLLVVRRHPQVRLREIADAVGITERAVQLILGDLERAGYVRRRRVGRRNEYCVLGGPLRHPLDHGHAVDDLLDVLGDA